MNDFGTFVRQQQEPLRRFLLSLCGGDLQLADDLAQESFIKAYVSFHTFGSRSRISTWLFRIAYNTFIDWTRKRKGETSLPACLTFSAKQQKRSGISQETETGKGHFWPWGQQYPSHAWYSESDCPPLPASAEHIPPAKEQHQKRIHMLRSPAYRHIQPQHTDDYRAICHIAAEGD